MKYKINDTILYEKIDGEYIIFDTVTENYLRVNEIGSIIFQEIIANSDCLKLKERVFCSYEVDKEVLEQDINDFLKELKSNNIIIEVNDES